MSWEMRVVLFHAKHTETHTTHLGDNHKMVNGQCGEYILE